MSEERVTLSEAAQILGVHRNTIRNWVMTGKLTSGEKHEKNPADSGKPRPFHSSM